MDRQKQIPIPIPIPPIPFLSLIDEAATSIVLNIAEGNGRFAHLDPSRFLDIANQATTKAAARLEISAIRGGVRLDEVDKIVRLLVEIDKMTAKLASVWKKE